MGPLSIWPTKVLPRSCATAGHNSDAELAFALSLFYLCLCLYEKPAWSEEGPSKSTGGAPDLQLLLWPLPRSSIHKSWTTTAVHKRPGAKRTSCRLRLPKREGGSS